MPPLVIVGLCVGLGGILLISVSALMTSVAASVQAYLRPGLNKDAFKRRNIRILRILGGIWILGGIGFIIAGLITGR